MTRYVDITVPLIPGRVPLYPGDTELEVSRVQARAEGGSANVSKLVCSLHCGTHVDGPAHFFDGEPGVDVVAVEQLIGPAWVVDARSLRLCSTQHRSAGWTCPLVKPGSCSRRRTPHCGTIPSSPRISSRSLPMRQLCWSSGAFGRSASTICPLLPTEIPRPPTKCSSAPGLRSSKPWICDQLSRGRGS